MCSEVFSVKIRQEKKFIHGDTGKTAPCLCYVKLSWVCEARLLICTKNWVENDPHLLHTNTSGQRGCMNYIVSIMVLLCMSWSPIPPLYNHCNIPGRHKLPTWKKVNEWNNNVQNDQSQLRIIDSVQSFLWIDKIQIVILKDSVCVSFCEAVRTSVNSQAFHFIIGWMWKDYYLKFLYSLIWCTMSQWELQAHISDPVWDKEKKLNNIKLPKYPLLLVVNSTKRLVYFSKTKE